MKVVTDNDYKCMQCGKIRKLDIKHIDEDHYELWCRECRRKDEKIVKKFKEM